MAASESRDWYCAVTTTSATTTTRVTAAIVQAMRVRTSGLSGRDQGLDPGAAARGRRGQRPADRLDPVPHARQAGAGRGRGVETAAVVVDGHRQAARPGVEQHPDRR